MSRRRARDIDEAILGTTINDELPAGSRLGEAANDGPSYWNGTKVATAVSSSAASFLEDARAFIPTGYPTVGQLVDATVQTNLAGAGTSKSAFIVFSSYLTAISLWQCVALQQAGAKCVWPQSAARFHC